MKITLFKPLVVAGMLTLGLTAFAETPKYEADYTTLLQEYVNQAGQVDYSRLKTNRAKLDHIIVALEGISPATFQGWNEDEQIAYLINAYNAFTLQVIIDHYPIQSNWKARLLGHPIGIRHIPGVWDDFNWDTAGQPRSLNDIEHKILRKNYNRPAIHMGLVCASTSCPKLRREAYSGGTLKDQLDDQSKEFLSHPENLTFQKNPSTVELSSIFKWFGDDFSKRYGAPPEYTHLKAPLPGVFAFLAKHLDDTQRERLASKDIDVDYLDYDWSLNDLDPKNEMSE